jgi:polyhydroxybutyrate depolymerase
MAFSNCEKDAEVILYTIEGAGHVWPRGYRMKGRLIGEPTDAIDATKVMWEFFSRHKRKAP